MIPIWYVYDSSTVALSLSYVQMHFIFSEESISEYKGIYEVFYHMRVYITNNIGNIQRFADDVDRCFTEYYRISGEAFVPLHKLFRELMGEQFGGDLKVYFIPTLP